MKNMGIALLLLVIAHPLSAEVLPVPGKGDPHIQTVAYDPAEVVALVFSPGFALTVQFSPDEQIETVILGDSSAWNTQTSRRADHLVLLPRRAPPPTNMTVFTDQRTYNFILYATPPGPGVQPYLVSFTYPSVTETQQDRIAQAGQYRLAGSKLLWPLEMGDDGRSTTIRWSPDVTLPAIYSENGRGDLALVNGVMREGNYVLDAVYAKLVFIRGRTRAQAVRAQVAP